MARVVRCDRKGAMPELSMQFIALPELPLNGVPIRLQRRPPLPLPAYIVLTGRTHSRDELVAFLGGDVADEPARKLVRNALTDLAAHGLGDYLITTRQSVAFDSSASYHLDVAQIEALVLDSIPTDSAMLAWADER